MSYHDEIDSNMIIDSTLTLDQDDSPWLEEEELNESNQISQQEWVKLSSTYSDAGYREGITSGKESHLQKGFDQGFQLATPFARELGTLRGITTSLLSLLTTTAGSKHISPISSNLEIKGQEGKENLILEIRSLVLNLNKLEEFDVLPLDQEAELHIREHEEEGMSLELIERREMKRIELSMKNLIEGIGEKKKINLNECRNKLEIILIELGLDGMLVPRRY